MLPLYFALLTLFSNTPLAPPGPPGAIPRTQQSKNADVVSVKDFGAVGDGNPTTGAGTDDTKAIQAAINSMGGGHDQQLSVYFPDGTYKITSTLTLPEGVELFGNGAWKSKIHYTGAGVAIQWTNGGNYDFPQIVRDIGLYSAGTYCINTGATSGGIVRNVWFGGPGGVAIPGTADLWITDNGFDGTSNGIVFTAASLCNNIEISRNLFTGNAYAITLKNARDVRINGNAFRGDATHNIHILSPSGTNTLIGIVINGNTFYTAAGVGAVGSLMMKLEGSALSDFVISNNTFDGCRAQGIYSASGAPSGFLFNGNVFNNIGLDVISFVGAGTKISIKNNIFNASIGGKAFNYKNAGVAVFSNNEVYSANGNARTNLDSTAVDIQQATTFVARHNTIISSAINYGIVMRSTVVSANAHDNVITGATVSEYLFGNTTWAPMKLGASLNPGGFGSGTNANGIWAGSGVPSNANGANGDLYIRTDTPGTDKQRIYVKAAGVWTGIL
jgi:Pectate lyase superfamily protein/Right handed beta helix region